MCWEDFVALWTGYMVKKGVLLEIDSDDIVSVFEGLEFILG